MLDENSVIWLDMHALLNLASSHTLIPVNIGNSQIGRIGSFGRKK